MAEENTTAFSEIYKAFLGKITADMFLELTEQDTMKLLQRLLVNSIPLFEFPRFNVFDYEEGELVEVPDENGGAPSIEWIGGAFHSVLTKEEINILAEDMVIEWINQQLKSTENIRQKMSGPDFKMSSQANHMEKLKDLLVKQEAQAKHLQRLYKRRKLVNGEIQTTMKNLMSGE